MTTIELKYAPRKCKYFCCGDCSISGRTCMTDFPDCRAAEPKDAEKFNLEDYTKDNPELAKEIEKEMKRMATNYEKMKPIKFYYLGSWFEYNNNIYVLLKDNHGEPVFEKLNEKPKWLESESEE